MTIVIINEKKKFVQALQYQPQRTKETSVCPATKRKSVKKKKEAHDTEGMF